MTLTASAVEADPGTAQELKTPFPVKSETLGEGSAAESESEGGTTERMVADKATSWFCLNDEGVSCIDIKAIEQSFAGRESAYMLFYIRKDQLEDLKPPVMLQVERPEKSAVARLTGKTNLIPVGTDGPGGKRERCLTASSRGRLLCS